MVAQTYNDCWSQVFLRHGHQSLDKMLDGDASWNDVLAVGEADLALGLKHTTITFGRDRKALDIGCGAGRMTHVLGLRFGHVLGIDTSPLMIEQANGHRQLDNVTFSAVDLQDMNPSASDAFDTIFSYEVFHYLSREQLRRYWQQSFAMLNPGGELVFQMNVEPITWKTRLSLQFRAFLDSIGIHEWRGWPNDPGFQRRYHAPEWIQSQLESIGFEIDQCAGRARQKWFRATRPR